MATHTPQHLLPVVHGSRTCVGITIVGFIVGWVARRMHRWMYGWKLRGRLSRLHSGLHSRLHSRLLSRLLSRLFSRFNGWCSRWIIGVGSILSIGLLRCTQQLLRLTISKHTQSVVLDAVRRSCLLAGPLPFRWWHVVLDICHVGDVSHPHSSSTRHVHHYGTIGES